MGRFLVAFCLFFAAETAQATEWEALGTEDGITVWQRAFDGQPLVEFRARGIVQSDHKTILAVLHDDKHKLEWLDSCVDYRRLKMLGPGRQIFYYRNGSNWPFVADRDGVIESATDIWRDRGRIRIDTWDVEDPSMPPIDGVVRMPSLRGSWVLQLIDDGSTEVTYTVKADPGGSLPKFVVNIVSKNIPRKTLQKLRLQVQKDGYDEALEYVSRSFDWTGFAVKPQIAPQKATAAP